LSKRSSFGLWPLVVLAGQILGGWRAEQNYRALPEVLPADENNRMTEAILPGVSIIVPARHEEAHLPRLLESLIHQDYPLYEIIVVDDASTDGTASIVRRYTTRGVRLIQSDGPPQGWTGKNHACWLGVGESIHSWLLFVDADTELAPSALRSSLIFAQQQGVSALSLFTRQRCETFWERLLLPFAYQQYFVGIKAQRVNSNSGPALANGQYFLIHRNAYQYVGGHAANAGSIIDDVALATRLKQEGIIPLACRGEKLVSVRMYANLPEIVKGFGKNSYLFLKQSPLPGLQTAVSTSLAASVLMLLVDAWRRRSRPLFGLAVLAYIAQALNALSWLRRFGVSLHYALLVPFSAIIFLAIALNSLIRTLMGRSMAWKGRSYRAQKRVRYRLPRPWFIPMGRAILTKTPRPIIEDSALAVNVLPKPPCINGTEHIPREGSFALVANHYQRFDLWIGWSGSLLIDTIARLRRDIAIHLVTTDRARIGRFTVPGTPWIIARVAAVWGLILVTPPAITNEHIEKQRYALLRMMRLLKQSKEQPICIGMMPEGDEGNASGLKDAIPGTGRALYALSSKGLPILPTVVWEETGQLYACFGEPFSLAPLPPDVSLSTLDDWARNQVMHRIAELLPSTLQGKFRRKEQYGALE